MEKVVWNGESSKLSVVQQNRTCVSKNICLVNSLSIEVLNSGITSILVRQHVEL